MKRRKIANLVIGFAILGGLSYCTANFLTAEGRVRDECAQIAPGMRLADLQVFAQAHGMRPLLQDSGVGHLVETRTFGRWSCRVELKDGVVTAPAVYNFED